MSEERCIHDMLDGQCALCSPRARKPRVPNASTFVMTVGDNDVSGERGEAYMLIPMEARDENPDFWEWTAGFSHKHYLERTITVIDGGADLYRSGSTLSMSAASSA